MDCIGFPVYLVMSSLMPPTFSVRWLVHNGHWPCPECIVLNKIEKKIILNQPPTLFFAADLSGVLILRMGPTPRTEQDNRTGEVQNEALNVLLVLDPE